MAVAVTAVVAAIEVTTVASVLAAVAAVGMATTVVGVVTGKPNLIKIGGELSLVGGLGGLANAAIQSAGSGALGAAGAGVAEGASEDAFSEVAGEKFAIAAGQDAAGSGFSAGASGAAGSFSPVIAGASDMDGIMGAAQNGVTAAPATSAADITAATGAPVTPGMPANPDLSGAGLGTKANGLLEMPGTPLSDAATPTLPGGTTDYSDLPQKYGTDQTTLDKIKSGIGKAWDSLSPQQKDMFVKSALAIPGGIQNQRNFDAQLALNQQKVNQSSYGSAVPTIGIIAKAQKSVG